MNTIKTDGVPYAREQAPTSPRVENTASQVAAPKEEQNLEQLTNLLSVVKNSAESSAYSQSVARIKQEIQALQYEVDMEQLGDNIAEQFMAEGVI